jgi:adenylate cyclase
MAPMPLVPVHWLYRRLRKHYPAVFFVLNLSVGLFVAAGTLWLITFWYEASGDEFLRLLLITEGLCIAFLGIGFVRVVPRLRPLKVWINGARSREATLAAWDAAVNMPIRVLLRDAWLPGLLVTPAVACAVIVVLDLGWSSLAPLIAVGFVASAYAMILQYFAIELGLQPVLDDINDNLPEDFHFVRAGLPLRFKLVAGLPMFSVITGLIVAAFTSRDADSSLGLAIGVTLAVAFTVGLELAALAANSIVRPLAAVRRAMASVQEGDFTTRVSVLTNDDLGELADGFNRMAAGLAERERLRQAFGTYLDRDVAEYILSQGVSPRGVVVDVSVLFCDVRDFTAFAERVEAEEVVASLNELFEAIVPVIVRHGGHVDKFVGDGLLAVFGAPEPFPDHADRALTAGCEIARLTEDGVGGDLRVGIGINSGRVVAGSIGGGGRLNFSVIGDAVNVAARVEAATRETGDSLLLTAETRDRLRRDVPLIPRGQAELKGREEPIELFAPGTAARARLASEAAARSA